MTDEEMQPAAPVEAAPVSEKPLSITLPVKSYRVIDEPFSRSPANEPMSIIEVELALFNEGNFAWHAPADCVRYRVERKDVDAALKAMGLK